MKKVRKNLLKFFGLLLVAVFVSQTLTFGAGNAAAEIVNLAAMSSTHEVAALAADNEISGVDALVSWLNNSNRAKTVKLVGGAGTVFDLTGKTYNTVSSFSGTFDGSGVTIKGLNKPLFGTLSGATVKNVYIGSGTISLSSGNYAGSIAKSTSGSTKITNCLNAASISLTSASSNKIYAGGIVGYAGGSTVIEKCSNHAKVYVNNTITPSSKSTRTYAYAGGIVGFATSTAQIKNCYVMSLTSSAIAISAKSKANAATPTTDVKETTKYYNGLSHVVEKVNQEFEKLKNQIAGKKNDESVLNKAINSVKSQISSLDRQINSLQSQINSYNSKISSLQSKINNAAWYDVRKVAWAAEIAAYRVAQAGIVVAQGALRVSQGALWVEIGALEASKVAIRALITTLEATLKVTAAILTYNVRDTNWLQYSVTKTVTREDAYAYGIGYMDSSAKTTNCYTYLISLDGGEHSALYKFHSRFWATSEFLGGAYNSNWFDVTLEFKARNYYGPIANKSATSCYYFTAVDAYNHGNNRDVYLGGGSDVYGNNKVDLFKKEVSVTLKLLKQQFFLRADETKGVDMLIANGETFLDNLLTKFAGEGTFVLNRNFDSEITSLSLYGTKKDAAKAADRKVLNNDIWGANKTEINGGMPYLKDRYWEEV